MFLIQPLALPRLNFLAFLLWYLLKSILTPHALTLLLAFLFLLMPFLGIVYVTVFLLLLLYSSDFCISTSRMLFVDFNLYQITIFKAHTHTRSYTLRYILTGGKKNWHRLHTTQNTHRIHRASNECFRHLGFYLANLISKLDLGNQSVYSA